jgi:hypothetical protein
MLYKEDEDTISSKIKSYLILFYRVVGGYTIHGRRVANWRFRCFHG